MKIKEICEKTGLTDRTVRYYIEEGLISPFYTENYLGRRSFDFSDQDLENLKNIATLRAFGFSVEEIKALSLKNDNQAQIIEAVKKRTEECLDESNRRLNILEGLDLSSEMDVSSIAKKLSEFDPSIKNETGKPNAVKRFFSFIGSCAIFLAIWIPIIASIFLPILKFYTLRTPIVRPTFLIYTLLCFLPSIITLVILQKLKRPEKILRLILTVLCIFCIPCSIFFSAKSVMDCDHSYETYHVLTESSCTQEGETVMKCSVCKGFETQKIPKLPHVSSVIKGLEPTCVSDGITDGACCSVCGETLTVQKSLSATKIHLPVTDPQIPPTCSREGLSEGSHCSVCNKVFVQQKVIPQTNHTYKITEVSPTCRMEGYTLHTCSCGYQYKTDTVNATSEHDFKKKSGKNYYSCQKCGLEVVAHGYVDTSEPKQNSLIKYYITGTNDYDTKNRTLVIYGSGDMPSYNWNDPDNVLVYPEYSAYNYIYHVSTVIIGGNITSIGEFTFKSKDYPDGYKSVTNIIIRSKYIYIEDDDPRLSSLPKTGSFPAFRITYDY